jgi:NADP-dependent 3-hydroxy acid dehydrogenase YdfG
MTQKVRFRGTVTLIPGASSGIGAALSRKIERHGGDLSLAARREERLQDLSENIRGVVRRALALKCDVTRNGDMEEAAAKVQEEFGRIDYVIANAAFGVIGKIEKRSLEAYRHQFETNVFGVRRTKQGHPRASFCIVRMPRHHRKRQRIYRTARVLCLFHVQACLSRPCRRPPA